MVLFSLLSDKYFTILNLTNILIQNVHIVVVCTAVMIIMISGGTDLSIGYQVSVASVIITKMLTVSSVSIWIAIPVGILSCMLMGTFNGTASLVLKSHSMMVTLGTMFIYEGISYLISQSKTFYYLPKSYMFIGQGNIFGFVPLNFVIMVVIVIIAGIIMSKTYLGRSIYLAGDNPEAARLGGLRVNQIKILAFTAAGFLVGISAILLSSRAGAADSTTGLGLEFTGIIACVLGGVSLKGGEGKLWKVVTAVFLLGVLSNGMQLINLGTYPQYITKGVIMLVSIYISKKQTTSIY
ncbi:MAG: ABC transporter permease [Anaerolineales bacterium]